MRSKADPDNSPARKTKRPSRATKTRITATPGSGKSHSLLSALVKLPHEQQRFALLLSKTVSDAASSLEIPESQVRVVLYRLVQAGLLQERKSESARRELTRALDPSLAELDPVPHATIEQARRLAALRTSLLRQGAFSTAAIADAKQLSGDAARQWISRARRQHRLFTVSHDNETLIPAFLLDETTLDPRPEAAEPIEVLAEAGEDGWALWAWFATPSVWTGGAIPAELLQSDPERVARAARKRAAASA